MPSLKKPWIALLLAVSFLFSACNKQKAEALKLAVASYSSVTTDALNDMNALFAGNLSSVSADTEAQIENIVQNLSEMTLDDIDSSALNKWTDETNLGGEAQGLLGDKFNELKAQYYTFEGMFTNLEKGTFFNKKEVKRAEQIAVKLNMQLKIVIILICC